MHRIEDLFHYWSKTKKEKINYNCSIISTSTPQLNTCISVIQFKHFFKTIIHISQACPHAHFLGSKVNELYNYLAPLYTRVRNGAVGWLLIPWFWFMFLSFAFKYDENKMPQLREKLMMTKIFPVPNGGYHGWDAMCNIFPIIVYVILDEVGSKRFGITEIFEFFLHLMKKRNFL